jgi:LuxR family maltose regulon positive regulatory protein
MSSKGRTRWIATLLRRALSEGIFPSYVGQILATSGQTPGGQPFVDQSLVEPLTAREIEILDLVAAGLRNQEFADYPVISPATVKRHLYNVYGKLGVSNRTQAVARGRELGLLLPTS